MTKERAKFITAYPMSRYDDRTQMLEYEYRGQRYTITKFYYDEPADGSLWYQHKEMQEKIDDMLDNPKPKYDGGEPAEIGINKFFAYMEGDEHAFDKN